MQDFWVRHSFFQLLQESTSQRGVQEQPGPEDSPQPSDILYHEFLVGSPRPGHAAALAELQHCILCSEYAGAVGLSSGAES